MKRNSHPTPNRREFLQTGVALGAGAVAASLLPGTASAGLEQPETQSAKGGKGYAETRHVRDYYRSARL